MPANKPPAAQSRLELEVRDFGPVAKARLDLRPLTVMVGPGNTGKSCLAILIYALHRLWSAQMFGSPSLGRTARPKPLRGFADEPEQAIDEAVEFAAGIADRAGALALPASLAEVLGRSYDKHGGYLDLEIRRCFGIEESAALIRRGAQGGASVAVRLRHRGDAAAVGQDFRIGAKNAAFRTAIPADLELPADTAWNDRQPWLLEALSAARSARSLRQRRELHSFDRFELLDALAAAIHPLVVGPLAADAFYLPAGRTGAMHARNVVVSALIGGAAMAGVRPAARTPMLPGVLADFLEALIELGQRPRTPGGKLGGGIEKDILRGAIGVEQSEAVGYPRFTYRPDGWRESLSLANASSMVSELAPLVLYLRHKVERGNMLVIEEPESHLHPAMQVRLTREIAALVQAGIRVVVTTHSEWVLEELANIVGRSGIPEPKAPALPALPAGDVGVWLFEPRARPRGSVVREIPLDESGLYPTGYGEVAAALHNDWAEITSRSQEPC